MLKRSADRMTRSAANSDWNLRHLTPFRRAQCAAKRALWPLGVKLNELNLMIMSRLVANSTWGVLQLFSQRVMALQVRVVTRCTCKPQSVVCISPNFFKVSSSSLWRSMLKRVLSSSVSWLRISATGWDATTRWTSTPLMSPAMDMDFSSHTVYSWDDLPAGPTLKISLLRGHHQIVFKCFEREAINSTFVDCVQYQDFSYLCFIYLDLAINQGCTNARSTGVESHTVALYIYKLTYWILLRII